MINMNNNYQITDFIQSNVLRFLKEDDICIDATLGKGRDSLFLLQHIPHGFLYGFDIQERAISASDTLLKEKGFTNYSLIHDSHEHILNYIDKPIGCAMFNLGYLPGGDHEVFTSADSTIKAVNSCLELLRVNGIISVCFYPGTQGGLAEQQQTLEYLKDLDPSRFLVLVNSFHNRPNRPPLPVFIIRLK